jgi:hypothetical protein
LEAAAASISLSASSTGGAAREGGADDSLLGEVRAGDADNGLACAGAGVDTGVGVCDAVVEGADGGALAAVVVVLTAVAVAAVDVVDALKLGGDVAIGGEMDVVGASTMCADSSRTNVRGTKPTR